MFAGDVMISYLPRLENSLVFQKCGDIECLHLDQESWKIFCIYFTRLAILGAISEMGNLAMRQVALSPVRFDECWSISHWDAESRHYVIIILSKENV
jgi:hypothetical protein